MFKRVAAWWAAYQKKRFQKHFDRGYAWVMKSYQVDRWPTYYIVEVLANMRDLHAFKSGGAFFQGAEEALTRLPSVNGPDPNDDPKYRIPS